MKQRGAQVTLDCVAICQGSSLLIKATMKSLHVESGIVVGADQSGRCFHICGFLISWCEHLVPQCYRCVGVPSFGIVKAIEARHVRPVRDRIVCQHRLPNNRKIMKILGGPRRCDFLHLRVKFSSDVLHVTRVVKTARALELGSVVLQLTVLCDPTRGINGGQVQ